jgi:nucleotide-binding universal stress UspA family protein
MPEHRARRSIVVGVDGSDCSLAALRWAAEQARVLHADVVAVHVWQQDEQWLAAYASALRLPTPSERRAHADRLLESAVRSVFGARPGYACIPCW